MYTSDRKAIKYKCTIVSRSPFGTHTSVRTSGSLFYSCYCGIDVHYELVSEATDLNSKGNNNWDPYYLYFVGMGGAILVINFWLYGSESRRRRCNSGSNARISTCTHVYTYIYEHHIYIYMYRISQYHHKY